MMKNQLDLSGVWSLAGSKWQQKSIPAELPGDNYSALLAAGEIPDPYYACNEKLVQEYRFQDWRYQREFEVPAELLAYDHVYLNAEEVDLFATFRINGKKVLTTDNMFTAYRPDVKPFLKPGVNTISIELKSTEEIGRKLAAEQPLYVPMNICCKVPNVNLMRKVHCHGGWDWGITLMVSGVYAPLTLTGVNAARLDYLHTEQRHEKNRVLVTAVATLFATETGGAEVRFTFNGETRTVKARLKAGENIVRCEFEVKPPRLWWPNGLGEAALYPLTAATADQSITREIGLRTLEVVNQPDAEGVSMYFRVNGVDLFAKGADWIPADAFPSRQTPEVYEDLLESTRLANMNMLRVWGGGQYEKELFYELCDRKGLLVWQDMMFSCSLYPSTPAFVESVCDELAFQIRRLRSHASLALWCGDNEVIGATGWYGHTPAQRTTHLVNYDRLNRELSKCVAKYDPERLFWPSSPCGGPNNFNDGWHDDSCGDMHYWEVWHGAKDFNAYYSVKPRFCSEFGYQSFPSLETVRTFCPEEEFNVFSPIMDHHQKCNKGNAPIIGMFGKYFRMPETFADFLYLSQAQQALAIKTGVEFWRTLRPRCMGTIYWQLNDNWPVASWASIEYGGKWKQLQYQARRFYAPFLAVMYKDETGVVRLYAVNDLAVRGKGSIRMAVVGFDGTVREEKNFEFNLKPGESKCVKSFKDADFAAFDPTACFVELYGSLESADQQKFSCENSYFFDVFKHCALAMPKIAVTTAENGDGTFALEITTDKPAFFFTLDVPGIPGIFSDNSFTLMPGKTRVNFTPKRPATLAGFQQALEFNHLRKNYR